MFLHVYICTCSHSLLFDVSRPVAIHWNVAFCPAFTSTSPRRRKWGDLSTTNKQNEKKKKEKRERKKDIRLSLQQGCLCFRMFLVSSYLSVIRRHSRRGTYRIQTGQIITNAPYTFQDFSSPWGICSLLLRWCQMKPKHGAAFPQGEGIIKCHFHYI